MEWVAEGMQLPTLKEFDPGGELLLTTEWSVRGWCLNPKGRINVVVEGGTQEDVWAALAKRALEEFPGASFVVAIEVSFDTEDGKWYAAATCNEGFREPQATAPPLRR